MWFFYLRMGYKHQTWTVDMELQCHLSPGASDLIATSSGALTDTNLHFLKE